MALARQKESLYQLFDTNSYLRSEKSMKVTLRYQTFFKNTIINVKCLLLS